MRADWLWGAVATAVSAVLFALSFPPWRWTFVSWVALAPFFVAVRRSGNAHAFVLGWLWCMIAAWGTGDWLPRGVADYFQQPLAVALGMFVGVTTAMAAPYVVGFVAAYRRLGVRFGPLAATLLGAAAWTAAELARGRLFTGTPIFIGNPWALAGYAQAPNLVVVQIASVTGVYGVSFAIACANAGLAEAWLAWRRGEAPRSALRVAALGAAPALAIVAFGAVVLGGPSPGGEQPASRVAIVQGNVALGRSWRNEYFGRNLDTYLGLTSEIAARAKPAIVFWPESALTFFLEEEPRFAAAIASATRRHDVELVVGGPFRGGTATAPEYFNSVWTLDPSGTIRGRYDKEYLVPFAEYFPLDVDLLRRRFGAVRSFSPGSETEPLPTRAGLAGMLVCNEAMLPEVAADRVARGATYLVNPTNDTWISDPKYTEQQLDFARMRAVEQRRYLVRASTAGPSAVIDPLGRVLVRTPGLVKDVAVGEIRPVEGRSPYGNLGDAFGAGCLLTVLTALAFGRDRS